MYWLFGIEFTVFGIFIMISSYDTKLIQHIQQNLTYDALWYILGLLVMCFGILYLATPLSKILAENKKFQTFYMKYSKKGDIQK